MERKKLLKAGISVAAVAILVASGYAINAYSKIKKFNDVIYPNVKVQGVDVGGKTKDEAKKILEEKFSNLTFNQKIIVNGENKEYILDLSTVKISYNIDETTEAALSYGKDMSFTNKYKAISNEIGTDLDLKYTVDDAIIDNYITTIKAEMNKEPVNAKISINNGQPQVIKEVSGKKIDEARLKEDLKALIETHKDSESRLSVAVESIEAKVTSDKINSVDSLVSSFTTSFTSSSYGRAVNIGLAAKTISGTILLPGEDFSFNNIVGDTTRDKGYQPAGVIVGDKIEQDYGGGICQVSTTLYNALMKLNLRPTERHPHNLPVSYVPIGTDAAIAFGYLDFKFKNVFDKPIYIESVAQSGQLTFNIYSSSTVVDKSKTYKLRNQVYATLSPSITYVDDPTLKVGDEKVLQKASQGYKARSYLDVYENGNLVESIPVGNDTYSPVNGKIAKGTKVVDTKPKEKTPTAKK